MTEREELLASWSRTASQLGRAVALLPVNPNQSDEGGRLDRYREYIDHNELELALEELQGLGELNNPPEECWTFLLRAAKEMGLDEHGATLAEHLRGNAG